MPQAAPPNYYVGALRACMSACVPHQVIGEEGLVMELASVTPGANVQTAETPGAVMTIARVPLDPRLGRR